jgi:hypothetical protein
MGSIPTTTPGLLDFILRPTTHTPISGEVVPLDLRKFTEIYAAIDLHRKTIDLAVLNKYKMPADLISLREPDKYILKDLKHRAEENWVRAFMNLAQAKQPSVEERTTMMARAIGYVLDSIPAGASLSLIARAAFKANHALFMKLDPEEYTRLSAKARSGLYSPLVIAYGINYEREFHAR